MRGSLCDRDGTLFSCCLKQDMTSSNLKAVFISSSLRRLILPLASCLGGKRKKGEYRRREGSSFPTLNDPSSSSGHSRIHFRVSCPAPPLPLCVSPASASPQLHHSWPSGPPTCSWSRGQPPSQACPDQRQETIKQPPVLTAHTVRGHVQTPSPLC